jgi:putative transposase
VSKRLNVCILTLNENNRSSYQKFFNEGVDEETKRFYEMKNQPAILGSDVFKNQQLDKIPKQQIRSSLPDFNRTRELPTLAQVKKICSSYFKVKEETLLSYQLGKENMPRRVAMYLSRVITQSRLEDIVNYFNCKTKSDAGNAVYKIRRDLQTDTTLAKQVNQLQGMLQKR